MKKALKIIMATLFVLSLSVLGTSCQKDAIPMDEIDEAALVIEPGSYNVKISMTANGVDVGNGLSGNMTESGYWDAEVTGTDSDSEVLITNSVIEMKTFVKVPTEEQYASLKKVWSDKEGYTFNDSKLTLTILDKGMNSDTTISYNEFIFGILNSGEGSCKSKTVYQSKDGSATKIVSIIEFSGVEGKNITTINRK